MSLGTIIGIAVGGAIALAFVLGAIACFCARRRHGRKKLIPEADENGQEETFDIKSALSSIRPPEVTHRRSASSTPFITLEGFDNQEWITHEPFLHAPVAKPKRHSSHKGFFRTTGMKDSWPLVTNIPLSLMSNHTIKPSEVAPPGYIVEDPKRPRRSNSLWTRKPSLSQKSDPDPSSPTKSINSTTSAKSAPLLGSTSPKFDPQFPPIAAKQKRNISQRPKQQRRSTSETHLSTILRSTSQRLKAAHRNSLTRTLSTLGRTPMKHPSEKLPDPPIWARAESREELIDKEYAEYIRNSLHNSFRNRTPSPVNESPRTFQPLTHEVNTQTPDQESPNSLCNIDTPDSVIPAPLSSPSKNRSPLAEKRQRMRVSSKEAKELAIMIHKDSRVSILAPGYQQGEKKMSSPENTILTGDPFYSGTWSPKSRIPKSLIPGQRPINFRTTNFGEEGSAERLSTFSSPLQDISHNVRTPPKESNQETNGNENPNPFQWSPQEAMQTRATQTSPRHTGARRKGHKRSNVMRISNISRPSSIVEVVPEEPEFESPLVLNQPEDQSAPVSEPEKASERRSNRRSVMTPPSSANFSPSLSIPKLKSQSVQGSVICLRNDRDSKKIISPTLSADNYYESSGGSEDEFFAINQRKSNHEQRGYSSELQAYPTYQLQRELQERLLTAQEELFSFPPPNISTTTPPTRPLPRITSTMISLRTSPVAPILTVPVPSHLTGPRAEPRKISRSLRSSISTMPSTISMLRRMNSEISNNGSASSAITSPNLSSSFSSLNNISEKDINKYICGSRNYLSLGSNSSHLPRPKNRSSRDCHRISKDRRKRQYGDFERLNDASEEENDEDGGIFVGKDTLTPVKEINSPGTMASIGLKTNRQHLVLKFPTLNREGSTQPTPESSPEHKSHFQLKLPLPQSPPMLKFQSRITPISHQPDNQGQVDEQSPEYAIPPKNPKRFSALTPTPVSHSTRRESKMEHPSPVTPISALGIAGLRLIKKGKDDVSPDSPGLYDDEGFLRGSPDREKVLKMREEDKNLREELEKRRNETGHELMKSREKMKIERGMRETASREAVMA